MKPPAYDPSGIAGLLNRFRARRPRVHCITNAVAETFTANLLLAAGAIPSMTINPEEVGDFVRRADALLVNLGTLDPLRRSAIDFALKAAQSEGVKWVLDPVFVERSGPRLALAGELMTRGPDLVRANAAELGAMLAEAPEEARVATFAKSHGTVVALTGSVDLVTDGTRILRIANGHELMSRITAMGCATTALMAGLLSVADDPVDAAVTCLAAAGVAAEAAGAEAAGPGSFVSAYLDALYRLSPDDVAARARIS